jgi:putative NADH-flavin reductase
MGTVILRVQGTESTLETENLTIDRILAEARAVNLKEFAVTRNGEEVESPDDLVVEDGDMFVILPADYADQDIVIDIANDDEGTDVISMSVKNPDAPE